MHIHFTESGPLATRDKNDAGLRIVRHDMVSAGGGGGGGVGVHGQGSDPRPGAEDILAAQTQLGIQVLGRLMQQPFDLLR